MFRLIRKLVGLAIIVGLLGLVAHLIWPEWWKSRIVPPMPVSGDCSVAEMEIAKYDWDTEIATAVAKAESSCKAEAKGDEDLVYQEKGRDYGYSVGIFQIRILPGREECDNYDVAKNVACAYKIYKESGWGAWSMYANGSYQRYLWRGLDKTFIGVDEVLKKK